MAELQATIEISVELNRFYNVDLFQRGHYQVQIVLKPPLKSVARIEVADNKINAQKGESPESTAIFRQSSVGKSKKFQIMYRNEEVNIGDIFVFRICTLVDSTKLEKNPENFDLRLQVQLWTTMEDESITECESKMEMISTRTLLLHLSPTKGLHYCLPVLFDYFHLSAIEIAIHGAVISIHQPYITIPKSQKIDQSTQEFLGPKITQTTAPPFSVANSSARIQQAYLMHKTMCSIILATNENLQDRLQQFATMIPGNKFQFAHRNCHTKLKETMLKVQGAMEEDYIIQAATSDINQLCAENVILWAQFLEIVLRQPQIHLFLATEHHYRRVRRFAEGFFTLEHNKSSCLSCYDPGVHGHMSLATMVRASPYFCNLPSLPVECVELDGDENSLPVIFEDIFRDGRAAPPQVYRKVAHNATDDNLMCSYIEWTSSSSPSSLTHSRSSSFRLRRQSSKRKFVKSLKTESQKRPSSNNNKTAEAAGVKPENVTVPPAGVTLIGYRKIPVPDTSSSVSLGTFSSDSQDTSDGPNLTGNSEGMHSTSMSSIISTDDLDQSSGGPVSDSGQFALNVPAIISQPHAVIYNPAVSVSDRTGNRHIQSSVTLQQSPLVSVKHTHSSGDSQQHSAAQLPGPENTAVSSSCVNDYHAYPNSHHCKSNWTPPTVQRALYSGMTELSKEGLRSLADNINQAFGEKKCVQSESLPALASLNDDSSNNDKTVVNGFEDVQCGCKQDFCKTKVCDDGTNILTTNSSSQPPVASNQGSQPDILPDIGSTQTLDSMNSDSALDGKTHSQEEISPLHSPAKNIEAARPDTAMTSVPAPSTLIIETVHPDVTMTPPILISEAAHPDTVMTSVPAPLSSISEAAVTTTPNDLQEEMLPLTLTQAVTLPSPLTPESQAVAPSSAAQGENAHFSTLTFVKEELHNTTTASDTPAVTEADTVHLFKDLNEKMTVMELLKEEYMRFMKEEPDSPEVDLSIVHKDSTGESSSFVCPRAASDSDIVKKCDEKSPHSSQKECQEPLLSNTNSDEHEKKRPFLTSSSSYPELSQSGKAEQLRLVPTVGQHTVNFVQLREALKLQMDFPGFFYSECPTLASNIPYFQVPSDVDEYSSGIHLIVCVHGLDGNSADLRLVRTYIEMALPGFKLDFLMSEGNQQDTFADFDTMTDKLVVELLTFLNTFSLHITRVSFVGHSLGNIIIRSALCKPELSHLLPKLYTFLSLSGPHLGTLYNTSGLVNMGMWFMQKWKKSGSLLQLSLKDHSDPRQTFLYRLSQKPVLQNFKHILLVGSHQDRYVPYHSSRIEICRSAQKDSSVTGAVYREMVQNILEPIIQSPHSTLIRYDAFHALPSTANTMIGRAAHIAVLDSEIFIEKFLAVTGLKYFQ